MYLQIYTLYIYSIETKGSRKKSSFFIDMATKKGGGEVLATKKKEPFLKLGKITLKKYGN